MIGYIYKTTNLIDGCVYIGRCISPVFKPSYYGSGRLLKEALKKYGKENFSIEILEESDSYEELNALERFYISQYLEDMGDDCYNIITYNSPSVCQSPEKYAQFVEKMRVIQTERSSKRLKNSWKSVGTARTNITNYDFLGIPCYIIFNNSIVTFPTKKKCKRYLLEKYGVCPPDLSKCTKDNPFKAKIQKHKVLNGLIFGTGSPYEECND